MWYALIDERSSCDAFTQLFWGDLENIAGELINESYDLIDNMTMGMDDDEIEEEYGDDIAVLEEFENHENYTEEMIRSFYFALSDCTIDVGCLVEGYPAFVDAYVEYAEDKWTLDEWRLVPEIEETDDNISELADELRSVSEGCDTECEMEYFIPNEYEE